MKVIYCCNVQRLFENKNLYEVGTRGREIIDIKHTVCCTIEIENNGRSPTRQNKTFLPKIGESISVHTQLASSLSYLIWINANISI